MSMHPIGWRDLRIRPTRAGWTLAVGLLLLAWVSAQYRLPLGFGLVWCLASCAAVSAALGVRNLLGLQLHPVAVTPVFAGQAAAFTLTLFNPTPRPRYGLGVLLDGARAPHWCDAAANSRQIVSLHWLAQPRGHRPMPAWQLVSRFPLGLLEMAHRWPHPMMHWVYPAPETAAPPAPGLAGAHTAADIGHLRPYRPGDPLHRVWWKKASRLGDEAARHWVSRDLAPQAASPCSWALAHCGLTDAEAQRARLCAWILQAEAQGQRYGLELPQGRIPASEGPAHRQRCLEALALS
jgi:uncharacterized protein (DUF58 family)